MITIGVVLLIADSFRPAKSMMLVASGQTRAEP